MASIKDHPRSRGVYCELTFVIHIDNGSSPLARGLLFVTSWARDYTRIIPARAGFTKVRAALSDVIEDHPRSRGVYSHAVPPNPRIMGSSPLARGLPDIGIGGRCGRGIIPARAGFTAVSYRPGTAA